MDAEHARAGTGVSHSAGGRAPEPPRGSARPRGDHLWPWIVAVALALVVLVNGIFLWIAVSGADEVAPSYTQGER